MHLLCTEVHARSQRHCTSIILEQNKCVIWLLPGLPSIAHINHIMSCDKLVERLEFVITLVIQCECHMCPVFIFCAICFQGHAKGSDGLPELCRLVQDGSHTWESKGA